MYKYSNDFGKLSQLVLIVSKVAITVTSLRSLERLFNSEVLLSSMRDNVILKHWSKSEKKSSSMWSLVSGYLNQDSQMKRDMLIHRCTEMIQIWADITMMYQGDFVPLHNFYRELRQKHVPFPSTRERKYFDDLRQMQMNVPIFDDVIIFQLDNNPVISKVDKKKWNLNVKNDENWKVFGSCKILYKCCKQFELAHKEL